MMTTRICICDVSVHKRTDQTGSVTISHCSASWRYDFDVEIGQDRKELCTILLELTSYGRIATRWLRHDHWLQADFTIREYVLIDTDRHGYDVTVTSSTDWHYWKVEGWKYDISAMTIWWLVCAEGSVFAKLTGCRSNSFQSCVFFWSAVQYPLVFNGSHSIAFSLSHSLFLSLILSLFLSLFLFRSFSFSIPLFFSFSLCVFFSFSVALFLFFSSLQISRTHVYIWTSSSSLLRNLSFQYTPCSELRTKFKRSFVRYLDIKYQTWRFAHSYFFEDLIILSPLVHYALFSLVKVVNFWDLIVVNEQKFIILSHLVVVTSFFFNAYDTLAYDK